jgi:predicted DNA-binding WGR domain protein
VPSPATPRPPSLLSLLPAPTATTWGIALHYEDATGRSDKEYRIIVDGARTLCQYGRSGTSGETFAKTYADPVVAVKEARKLWASKERKGYWPMTGVVTEPNSIGARRTPTLPPVYPETVKRWITAGYAQAVQTLRTQPAGDRLWLVQAPGRDLPDPHTSLDTLTAVAHRGGTLAAGLCVTAGQYLLVAVAPIAAVSLSAVCPVSVELGARTAADTVALAEISTTLWRDLEHMPARPGLARTLEVARALMR